MTDSYNPYQPKIPSTWYLKGQWVTHILADGTRVKKWIEGQELDHDLPMRGKDA